MRDYSGYKSWEDSAPRRYNDGSYMRSGGLYDEDGTIEGWRLAQNVGHGNRKDKNVVMVNEAGDYIDVPKAFWERANQEFDASGDPYIGPPNDADLRGFLMKAQGSRGGNNGLTKDEIDDIWTTENERRGEYATQAHPTSLMMANPLMPVAMQMLGGMGYGTGGMPDFNSLMDMNQFMRMPFSEGLGGMFPDPRVPINPHIPEGSLGQPKSNTPGGNVPPGYGALPNQAPSWAQPLQAPPVNANTQISPITTQPPVMPLQPQPMPTPQPQGAGAGVAAQANTAQQQMASLPSAPQIQQQQGSGPDMQRPEVASSGMNNMMSLMGGGGTGPSGTGAAAAGGGNFLSGLMSMYGLG